MNFDFSVKAVHFLNIQIIDWSQEGNIIMVKEILHLYRKLNKEMPHRQINSRVS